MIIGSTTEEFTIFAACDSVYLRDHAKGLVTSCALVNNNVHIHVTNPSERDQVYLEYLKEGYKMLCPEGSMTTSYDTIDLSKFNSKERKTFYACNRFIVGADVIKCDVLILDVDCYLMQHVDPLDCDIGLFLREPAGKGWDYEGSKIAAGVVYCNRSHLDFLGKVKSIIETHKMTWLVDQVALYQAYEQCTDKRYLTIGNDFMDWDFRPTSKIWTGKGTRKMWNVAYTKRHNDIKRKFPIKEEDYFNEKSSTTGA